MDSRGRWTAFHDGCPPQVGADALGIAMALHHVCTAQHCEQVATLAREVGERLGLERDATAELELAARLHDVGKIAVPDSILDKAESLTEAEWEVMKCHPVWGAEALRRAPGLEGIAAYVRSHHERWDGGGYPDGLSGERIPRLSRILAGCDAYSAMIEERPYRTALEPQAALAELHAGAGQQFDPEVVDVLTGVIDVPAGAANGRLSPAARQGTPEPALAA